MKLTFTRFMAICLAMLTFQFSFAQTNYRSASSGDWTTSPATRWEIETSPGVWGPAATAPTSADGVITIRNGHNITVGLATVTADQVVVASGGTLTVNNTLTLNDGTGIDLEVAGTLNLNNTLATGTGTPTVQIDATMDWIGGTLSVPTTITATGTLNINTSNKTLSTTLTNDGTINWSASLVNFNNGTLNNNGTFNASDDNALSFAAGTNAFNNNASGVFTKSGGAANTTISIPVTNAGTFNMNSGTIISTGANATFSNTGTLNFGGGALTIAGTLAGGNALNGGTVFSGTGTLNINNLTAINLALAPPSTVTLSIGGPAANTTLLNGTGSLSIDGIFDWSTARVAIPVTINATGTFNSTAGKDFAANFTNNGTINLTDGPPLNTGSWDFEGITFTNNGTINANYTGNRLVSNGGGTNSFVNNGTYHKTTGVTVTFAAGVPVTNNGTFEGIGAYVFTGGITNTGTISPGTPGTSPGILTIGPNAITGNSTTLRIGILNSTTPGTGHDQLIVTNSVNLTNAILYVREPSGDVAPVGSYTIMTATAGTITGPFASVNIPGNWSVTYNPTSVVLNKLGSTLPLVWGSFTATAKSSNQVQLNWTTLEETNTSHFVIEQSVDGRNYTYLGTVPAKGNSNGSEYSFVDGKPDRTRVNHYRIKQVDNDGKFSYSYIRSVRFDKGNVAVVLATPNPVRDVLQITVQERVNVIISDLNGRVVRKLTLGAGYHPVNMQNLQKGVYQLAVYRDNELLDVQKLVKQ
jgi:hypothetical protein